MILLDAPRVSDVAFCSVLPSKLVWSRLMRPRCARPTSIAAYVSVWGRLPESSTPPLQGHFKAICIVCSQTNGNSTTGVSWVNIAHLPVYCAARGTTRCLTRARAQSPRVSQQPKIGQCLSDV